LGGFVGTNVHCGAPAALEIENAGKFRQESAEAQKHFFRFFAKRKSLLFFSPNRTLIKMPGLGKGAPFSDYLLSKQQFFNLKKKNRIRGERAQAFRGPANTLKTRVPS